MTVVIHDSDKKHNMLMAIIPLSNETGQLISEVVLRLRDLFFARGWFLVFGGGDGAAANLDAWRRVKSHSTQPSSVMCGMPGSCLFLVEVMTTSITLKSHINQLALCCRARPRFGAFSGYQRGTKRQPGGVFLPAMC